MKRQIQQIRYFILLPAALVGLSGCNLGFVSFGSKSSLGGTDVDGRPLKPAVEFVMNGPESLELGICTKFSLVAEDDQGRVGFATRNITIGLNLTSGQAAKFYSDSNCTQEIAGVGFAKGLSEADFYVRPLENRNFSMAVNATGFGFKNRNIVVTRNPQRVGFRSIPPVVGGGRCSAPLMLEVQDGLGLAFPLSATISLTSGGSGKFYSDEDCTNEISTVFANASGTATVHYRIDEIESQVPISLAIPSRSSIQGANTSFSISRVVTGFQLLGGPNANFIFWCNMHCSANRKYLMKFARHLAAKTNKLCLC